MNSTIEERKEDAEISAHKGDNLEDVAGGRDYVDYPNGRSVRCTGNQYACQMCAAGVDEYCD